MRASLPAFRKGKRRLRQQYVSRPWRPHFLAAMPTTIRHPARPANARAGRYLPRIVAYVGTCPLAITRSWRPAWVRQSVCPPPFRMNRFDRITGILLQLQAKRVVRGQALADRFGVSLRTIYRDLRTLEEAGVPLYGEAGVGFSLAEGYSLPPVMFTRDEATALLTGEKLAARLTDEQTATHSRAAMDKLRAVLRRPDRDYLDALAPRLQVLRLRTQSPASAAEDTTHQRLLAGMTAQRVVRLRYRAGLADTSTERDVEPIGCYLQQHWHLVAYCRLRQDFRDFRFDRIEHLELREEIFTPRPETLQSYWSAQEARRQELAVALVRFQPEAVRNIQDTKHQYGWVREELLPDGTVEMAFLPGSLRYLAAWLLPQAGSFTAVAPPELRQQLRELAQLTYDCFCEAG